MSISIISISTSTCRSISILFTQTDVNIVFRYRYVCPCRYRYLQALEGEKGALRLELQQKYATASEEPKALSEEKLAADEACSRLRQEASKLEERSALASSELEVREIPPPSVAVVAAAAA